MTSIISFFPLEFSFSTSAASLFSAFKFQQVVGKVVFLLLYFTHKTVAFNWRIEGLVFFPSSNPHTLMVFVSNVKYLKLFSFAGIVCDNGKYLRTNLTIGRINGKS